MTVRTPMTARGALLALAATILWSGNFVAARAMAGQMSPVTLGFFRWLTACCFILPFCHLALKRDWPYIKAHWRFLLITALSGLGFFALLIYIAANFTSVLNLTLIAASSPIFTLIMARVILKEELTFLRIVGISLALAGVVGLAVRGDLALLSQLKLQAGDLLALTAAVLFAVYNILLRYRPIGSSNQVFVAMMLIFSLLGTIPFVLIEWGLGYGHLELNVRTVFSVLYLSLGASISGIWIWNKAVDAIGPGNAIIFYYFLPFFGGLGALLLLNEPVAWIHVVSGLLILSGTLLASRNK